MRHLHLPLLLALTVACGPALAQEGISKVNGSISAEPGQAYGALETVNGSIKVADGVETGGIQTVNGSIRLGQRVHSGGISTVNGGVRLGTDVVAQGDVRTVNGSIFSDRRSHIQRDVETVNGGIGLVETRVDGDVTTVNGDVTVGVGSVLAGNLLVKKPSFSFSLTPARKPRVIVGPNAVVEGTLTFERDVVLYVHRSARTGPISGAEAIAFDSDSAPEN